jgi:hypothetical protein
MLIVVTSGKAAPGVTTSTWALALSWPRPVVVADCDPNGGDMAPGLLAGRVSADRGLLSWSSAARRGMSSTAAATMFSAHAVGLPERRDVWLLTGFTNATQGCSFTEEIWERLASALGRSWSATGRDALVDSGRLVGEQGNWPVLRAADHVLLAVRPSVRSVHAAQDATARLRYELGDLGKVSALVVGDGPYSPREVAAALQIPLGGSLPYDRQAAAVLSDGASAGMKASERSALLRSAASIARKLAANGQPSPATYTRAGV